jgi:hypothetical protein
MMSLDDGIGGQPEQVNGWAVFVEIIFPKFKKFNFKQVITTAL